jgi:hypothetical protein
LTTTVEQEGGTELTIEPTTAAVVITTVIVVVDVYTEIVGQLADRGWCGNGGVIVDRLADNREVLPVEEKEPMPVS